MLKYHILKYSSKVVALPLNEPLYEYLQGSQTRNKLEEALNKYKNKETTIPIVIGDKEYHTDSVFKRSAPFDHSVALAKCSYADEKLIKMAIKECIEARDKWEKTKWDERAQIFRRAADLVSDKYRYDLLATTMLGQGKTIFQAEIDAAAEFADFLRFNVYFAEKNSKYKPIDVPGSINTMCYRGMDGFWAAITPFNFTAIAGNLPATPAMMGNVVVWKPTDSAILSNYICFKIFQEAGLPPNIINFIPADGPTFGNVVCRSPQLAGINFTGSLKTFRTIYKQVGNNIDNYLSFPKLIGECGGKNFHFVHPSADLDRAVLCTVKGAFEYSGQKCSATSRLYVPRSMWAGFREKLVTTLSEIKVGSPLIHDVFMSSVIDEIAFKRIKSYIDYATLTMTLVAGGKCDSSEGFFVEPTVFETDNPNDKMMLEEIFGPVLTVYVYDDCNVEATLKLAASSSNFALTGAIFAHPADNFIKYAQNDIFRQSCGNFYINNPSTGSVVGQQPFGGDHLSGTNDKAGGPHYALRFASPQSIKEQIGPIPSWCQGHMK